LGLTRLYLGSGAKVFACARSLPAASDLLALKKTSANYLTCLSLDVADSASCAAMAHEMGKERIDVLINNAGAYDPAQRLADIDFENAETVFRANTWGPLRVTRALAPLLNTGARVVNITSKMGSIADNAQGGAYVYRMSKAALNMATKTLALEWRDAGTTVVAIHPGWVQTRMGGASAPLSAEEATASIMRTVDGLTPKHTGTFLNYDGAPIPW
jgi:NAD(P)-dependent dehydrogenase (short-subunit alcohol dehydrogenase family)